MQSCGCAVHRNTIGHFVTLPERLFKSCNSWTLSYELRSQRIGDRFNVVFCNILTTIGNHDHGPLRYGAKYTIAPSMRNCLTAYQEPESCRSHNITSPL